MEFLAVRRAEGADVCHSFLVRLDRCGRVCQRNIEEVHVKVGRLHVFCVSGFMRAIEKYVVDAIFIAIKNRILKSHWNRIKLD